MWETTLDVLAWITIALLMIGGFIGTFLPILPGTLFIFLGGIAHYFMMGREDSGLTWQSLVVLFLLLAVSVAIDWVSGALGAKWFGASKWGAVGALIGGIVGIFFGLIGLIVGPILGAFGAEMLFAKKEWKPATKSSWGTVVGGLAGIAAKATVAVLMIGWYLADVFLIN